MSGALRDQNDKLSVCALVPYPVDTAPSQRFRIEQWMPYLKAQGISMDILPFADKKLMQLLRESDRRPSKALALTTRMARRLLDVAAISRYDVVFIHRAICMAGPATLERIAARLGRPIIFDFDDAIFLLHTAETNRRFGWMKFPGKTAAICRLSSHIIVGNSFLADYAGRYNSNVTVIPSSVDTARFRPASKASENRRIIVGWTGSSTSQTYLEMFAPVLKELVMCRDVELRVHSDREPLLPRVPFVWRPWSADTEVEELSQFDIGIMPMPDDLWARGKCAMKALLYMSMEIPTVCSDIGANQDVINHGENGFLATTAEEFLAHVVALIDDRSLRDRIGKTARRTVEEFYSVHQCVELFARVVRKSVETQRLVRTTLDTPVVTELPLKNSRD